ncbi:MAG: LemA family protein [Gammaproteobacteria bacterium]|jgi:LemA protein|nr:LemA family protein [Gammaproteobacteria bacterium]MDH3820539.1 LemA family protein [Gammaproteobacteria bacterium]
MIRFAPAIAELIVMTSVVIAALALLGVAGVVIYNRLIRSRNRVDTSWSDIDVQLQRRHDLIPRLVTAVDQYAKYERATLEAVTELRSEAMQQADVRARGRAEEKLSAGIERLIALAENYPDLKANENFLSLQNELVETENYLQFARRYYNGSVRDYNTMTESVPSNIIAGMFNFTQRDFFQKTSDEAANVPLANFGSVE